MSFTFDPWIGSKYNNTRLNWIKLLIIGESHYGKKETERRETTKEIAWNLGQINRHQYYTIIAKLELGFGKGNIRNEVRADFWDCVAFSNYIQEFVADDPKARARPTEKMWYEAIKAVVDIIDYPFSNSI